MKLFVSLDEGAFLPERAHPTDAGADLRSPVETVVPAKGSVIIDTGVHIQIPKGDGIFNGFYGALASKSGLNARGITTRGTIDQGYTGSIRVVMQNSGDDDFIIHRGDKITQIIIVPCFYADIIQTEAIEGGERGSNGFGSTGR